MESRAPAHRAIVHRRSQDCSTNANGGSSVAAEHSRSLQDWHSTDRRIWRYDVSRIAEQKLHPAAPNFLDSGPEWHRFERALGKVPRSLPVTRKSASVWRP